MPKHTPSEIVAANSLLELKRGDRHRKITSFLNNMKFTNLGKIDKKGTLNNMKNTSLKVKEQMQNIGGKSRKHKSRKDKSRKHKSRKNKSRKH